MASSSSSSFHLLLLPHILLPHQPTSSILLLPRLPPSLISSQQPTSTFPSRLTAPLCAARPPATTAIAGVIEIQEVEALEKIIQESGETLVVINVSTKTCGPCKLVYPKFVKMSKEYPDAIFLKINGDLDNHSRALMQKWKVRAVPTFKFFRGGKLIHSHSGANEDDLRAYFLRHYSALAS